MTDIELRDSFRIFRTALMRDMTAQGFPSSFVGAILRWFDPTSEDYLTHVDQWKQALCRGACYKGDVPTALLETGVFKESVFHTLYPDPERGFDIKCVHAIANLFYKCRAPARKATDWEAVKHRLSTPPVLSLTKADIRHLRHALRHVDVLPDFDSIGRYGPGITSEGFSQSQRWSRKGLIPPVPPSWYRVSPFDTWEPDGIAYDFRCTKIAEVPKTLKANRIVSAEPAQSMFAQLMVSNHLDRLIHRVFAGSVYLHDQALHNTLLRSTEYRSIDLSDASDYISCDLVSLLLPTLWPLLARVRSTHAVFPDGDVIELRTFAPMGSGICFPVLTLVNLAIGKVICRKPFHFYGDDGIVHRDDVISVTDMQQASGLVVNQGKTCYHGLFRESCGMELFGNMDISPCYIRDTIASTEWTKLNQIVEFFDDLGWSSSAEVVGAFVASQHPVTRVNVALQRHEMSIPTRVAVDKECYLDGYNGIRKWLCQRGQTQAERESLVSLGRVKTRVVRRFRTPRDYSALLEAAANAARGGNPSSPT